MNVKAKRLQVVFTAVLAAGIALASVGTANAAGVTLSPTPTSSSGSDATATPPAPTYAQQLEAFKVAQAAYELALAKWKVDFAAWQAGNKAAIDANNVVFQNSLAQFEAAQKARKAQRATIDATFNAAIQKANSDYKSAKVTAKTADQKLAIHTAFDNAKGAAVLARQSALDALGPDLVRPVKPAVSTLTVAPVKPVQPIKPVKPEVTSKAPKPSKTDNSKGASASPVPSQKTKSKS